MSQLGTIMTRTFRLALVQLNVGASKPDNLTRATKLINEAASKGASVVALPECFNSPYGTGYFPEYAEPIPGPSTDVLKSAAIENDIFLVGGSIPEEDGGKIYNTCTVFNPSGEMIAKHRKMHLVDIDIPGKITFKESETLTAGSKFTVFDTPMCKIGIGICYDIRFAEMAQLYSRQGCKLLLYPGAFNMTTGAVHWELLTRARAVDNQLYVATVSPARDENAKYVAWGHSSAVSPWGEVVATCDHEESIVYTDIDLDLVDQVRGQIPISVQRRNDLYEVKEK